MKAWATQTKTSLFKQHDAGEHVDLLDDYHARHVMSQQRTITEAMNLFGFISILFPRRDDCRMITLKH